MKRRKLGILAAVFANIFWGFSFMASKVAQSAASPLVLLAWRFPLALLLLLIPAITGRKRISFPRHSLPLLLLMALMEPVVYFLGEQYGILYTNSSTAGVFIAMIPIVAILVAFFALGEKPAPLQWLFCAVSIGGIVWVTLLTSGSGGDIRLIGIVMLIVAVVSAAVYSNVSKHLTSSVDAYSRTVFIHIVGTFAFLGMALAETRGQLSAFAAPLRSGAFLPAVGYLSLFASVGGFYLHSAALSLAPVANVAVISNVSTVISVTAGVLVMGDPFSPMTGAAMAVALLGVWGVQHFSRAELSETADASDAEAMKRK